MKKTTDALPVARRPVALRRSPRSRPAACLSASREMRRPRAGVRRADAVEQPVVRGDGAGSASQPWSATDTATTAAPSLSSSAAASVARTRAGPETPVGIPSPTQASSRGVRPWSLAARLIASRSLSMQRAAARGRRAASRRGRVGVQLVAGGRCSRRNGPNSLWARRLDGADQADAAVASAAQRALDRRGGRAGRPRGRSGRACPTADATSAVVRRDRQRERCRRSSSGATKPVERRARSDR